jgi:hypothetical protein
LNFVYELLVFSRTFRLHLLLAGDFHMLNTSSIARPHNIWIIHSIIVSIHNNFLGMIKFFTSTTFSMTMSAIFSNTFGMAFSKTRNQFGRHFLQSIDGSNPVDYTLFFTDDYSSLKKIFLHDSSSSCQESWNNWQFFLNGRYYTIGIIQYHKAFKKRIAQCLAYWFLLRKVYGSSSKSNTLCMSEEDFIFYNWCKERT